MNKLIHIYLPSTPRRVVGVLRCVPSDVYTPSKTTYYIIITIYIKYIIQMRYTIFRMWFIARKYGWIFKVIKYSDLKRAYHHLHRCHLWNCFCFFEKLFDFFLHLKLLYVRLVAFSCIILLHNEAVVTEVFISQ